MHISRLHVQLSQIRCISPACNQERSHRWEPRHVVPIDCFLQKFRKCYYLYLHHLLRQKQNVFTSRQVWYRFPLSALFYLFLGQGLILFSDWDLLQHAWKTKTLKLYCRALAQLALSNSSSSCLSYKSQVVDGKQASIRCMISTLWLHFVLLLSRTI